MVTMSETNSKELTVVSALTTEETTRTLLMLGHCLLVWDLFGISILMGPYDSRPCEGSPLTASLLLMELQLCKEYQQY